MYYFKFDEIVVLCIITLLKTLFPLNSLVIRFLKTGTIVTVMSDEMTGIQITIALRKIKSKRLTLLNIDPRKIKTGKLITRRGVTA